MSNQIFSHQPEQQFECQTDNPASDRPAPYVKQHWGQPWQRLVIVGAIAFCGLASCAARQSTAQFGAQPNDQAEVSTPDRQVNQATAEAANDAEQTTAAETTSEIAQRPAQNPAYEPVTVLQNLENPWGMAWLPNGDMLITERSGQVRLVREGQLQAQPVAGVTPDLLAQGQGGLLDIVLHPDFAANQWVYFSYAQGTIGANRTRIARAKFDGQRLNDWQVIFEVAQIKPRGQHFGSRLTWLPDGTLLASIGDGGNPPVSLGDTFIREQAQNVGSHLGKVIRINDDGSIPADNPFVNTLGAEPEVWSYGHRNIQGLAIDPVTNQVWASEHGARGGDEVNQVLQGENYGWPVATHSREYSGGLISPETSLPGMIDPQVIWTPSIAPSGLAVYRGDRFPEWQGNLFAGGLVSQDVRRLVVDDSGTITDEIAIPIGQRVRDVQQGPDGLLYILTDERNGQLIRLQPE
ncbi:MAG: PQQ-dependent sugar dehydrogenase [Cyanobacteria bacterium P01_H01_bin.121]